MRTILWLAPALLLLGLNAFATDPLAITGDYIEVRSSHVYTCGCLYSGEAVTVGRDAILVLAVRQGEFRGAPLAGMRAVAVVYGDGHLGIRNTARKSVLYIDGADSPEPRQALAALLRERYGEVLGDVIAVHTAPVSFDKQAQQVTLSVGEISRVVMRPARLPEDAHAGSSLWYDPLIPTSESTLGTAEYASFNGNDFKHKWWTSETGIRGYIASFVLSQ